MRGLLLILLASWCVPSISQDAKKQLVPPVAEHTKRAGKAKNDAQPQQTIAVALPSPVNVAVTGKLEMKPSEQHAKTHDEPIKWSEWLIAAFTGLLVYVTAKLVFFTKKLWNSTSELVEDAKSTSKHELRAYLGATPKDITLLSSTHLQTYIEITNTGKTPAKNVRRWRNMEVRNPTDRSVFHIEPLGPESRPIAPGHNWTIGIELTITNEQRVFLIEKKLALFVWGRVEYEDCFGKAQTLEFRYQNIGTVFVQSPEGARQILGWALHPEPEGNDAT